MDKLGIMNVLGEIKQLILSSRGNISDHAIESVMITARNRLEEILENEAEILAAYRKRGII